MRALVVLFLALAGCQASNRDVARCVNLCEKALGPKAFASTSLVGPFGEHPKFCSCHVELADVDGGAR